VTRAHARSRRLEISPAALGSVALHAAVALAFMITWGARDLKVGAVVPVTIVSSAPDVDTRPAQQADETQTAATETPQSEAPPEPVPPPAPAPAPAPNPKAKPVEKAPAPTPTPTKTAPQKSFDLDALAASLTKPARNQPQRPSAAAQGPSRPETAPVARQTTGSGLAAGAALQGLAEELQRRWNPNCNVEGGGDIIVRTVFRLELTGAASDIVTQVGGQTIGRSTGEDLNCQTRKDRFCLVQTAADRAAQAVSAAAPFRGLPRELYGQRIAVNFNAREACAR
jgi:hypothetical protein